MENKRKFINLKEQYLHPKWQKKKLETLEHYNWACELCNEQEKMLHIHHINYKENCKIWEYNVGELQVLCEDCHKEVHYTKEKPFDFNNLIRSLYPEQICQYALYEIITHIPQDILINMSKVIYQKNFLSKLFKSLKLISKEQKR
jgi:hypothetical protein